MVYDVSVSEFEWRDVTELVIRIRNVPTGKGQEVGSIVQETISQFREENLFELLKKNTLRRLKNYQDLPSEIADRVTADVAIYDRPITLREKIEETESLDFKKAREWINQWLSKDRILTIVFTP
jgi:predicted Zn-dependent peptidase